MKKRKKKQIILGVSIGLIILIAIGIIFMNQVEQTIVRQTDSADNYCNIENNLCRFSLSDPTNSRGTGWNYEFLNNGLTITISQEKCQEIEGIWTGSKCDIWKNLKDQMPNINIISSSKATIRSGDGFETINVLSVCDIRKDVIYICDPIGFGVDIRGGSITFEIPIYDKETTQEDTTDTTDTSDTTSTDTGTTTTTTTTDTTSTNDDIETPKDNTKLIANIIFYSIVILVIITIILFWRKKGKRRRKR